jgi:hypothetical protein
MIASDEISDQELKELEELLRLEEIDMLYDGLINPGPDANPNFKYLKQCFQDQKWNANDELIAGKKGVALEGSTRSGKTWSGVDFIIWLCTRVETNCKINIYRATFAEFKDTLYEDFRRRLDDFGIPNKFENAEVVKSFRIGGNVISFKGCDKLGKNHGAGADYVFFNEIMHIPEGIFNHAAIRCRKFWWADYNPSFSSHWFFDRVVGRKDVGFLRTTFQDNPFISPNEKKEITIKEPWQTGSYYVTPEGELMYNGSPIDSNNQPPPNLDNLETADEYFWRVYGLGLRGSMEGVIIDRIHWIDEFPEDMGYFYGNDFGFSVDPNALVRYAEDENNIYFELLCYNPVETDDALDELYTELGIEKALPIICDSSDRFVSEHKGVIEMVKGLRKKNWRAKKVKKTKSVMYWLTSMKKKKLHCVKNHLWQKVKTEQENYKFKKVAGIQINQPEDKYNHCFSADTMVLTTKGNKMIVDVVVGDIIINSFGEHKVINSFLSRKDAETNDYKISCGIGNYYVSSTSEHKVKTLLGWKEISQIKKGDCIWTPKSLMASSTIFTREKGIFHEEGNDFTELYGSFTTEKYQRDFTFITKTIIRTIIALIILFCLLNFNILANIKKHIVQKIKIKSENIWTKSGQKQRNGTHQMKELNGIANTLKGTILEMKHSVKEIVRFAIQSLPQKQMHKNSVLTLVNHNTVGTKDLIMNIGTASFVGISLRLINIQSQKPVLRNVQTNTVLKSSVQDVYDLTIEDKHEFLANEILVHNCFDAVRYCHIEFNRPQMEMKTEKSVRSMGVNY